MSRRRQAARAAPSPAALAVAVDVGGTFTDVTLLEPRSGRLLVAKTPTTRADPSAGFLAGVDRALRLAGVRPGALGHVLHGTTTATNAILEGKGASTALLTTAGFRYVLEIGRHDIPRRANMFAWQKPARPVPPERVLEIRERLAADGAVLEPLDEADVRAAVRRLREAGVEAVAVCLLHSYANPAHERRVRELVLAEGPDTPVSLSSEVLPVFREYERSMATVLDAYVRPLVGRYLARLEAGLRDRGVRAPLRVMKSNGGVVGADVARRQPIHTALSGPAAGVVAARVVGEASGYGDLISLDVGGTSADVCLIRAGEAEITTEGRVGAWPLHVPMVAVHTIGAGGGSIARVAEDGTLAVGPESAGAQPGPACYGTGGEAPTVTDAHLVLGRIPPALLGGEIPLDAARARRAVLERVARPLGLSLEAAASGILEVVDHGMVAAIRLVSVEQGYDPRAFALVAFGGAGPLHGGRLAALLGMRTVIVPRHPGVLSTLGLLAADVRQDYARTALQRPPDYDRAAMAAVYAALEAEAAAWLDAEGVPPARRELRRFADLRYRHQGFELTVPWEERDLAVAPLLARFHAHHRRLYTYAAEDAPVEIVTLRVRAVGRFRRLVLPRLPRPPRRGAARPAGRRPVYFAEAGGWLPCPVYAREALPPGVTLAGPAVVEQLDATTVLAPGQRATVDDHGHLVVRLPGPAARAGTAPAARAARAAGRR